MADESEKLSPLEAKLAAREARKAKTVEAREAQELLDIDALDAAEIEHGDECIAHLELAFSPGLPTIIVARLPTDYELKHFRNAAKSKPGKGGKPTEPDHIAAAELISDYCVVYPKGETLEKLYAARPGVKAQIGAAAVQLTLGQKEATGKE